MQIQTIGHNHGSTSSILCNQLPAYFYPASAKLLAFLYYLDQTQWWPADKLLTHQFTQLDKLLRHASAAVPYYRERFDALGIYPDKESIEDYWQSIPILTRSRIQESCDMLNTSEYPESHGEIKRLATSGSTGRPITVRTTGVSRQFFSAFTLRDYIWHHKDLSGKYATIRGDRGVPKDNGHYEPDWGSPFKEIFDCGPIVAISSSTSIDRQLEWLQEQQPAYLLSLPTNLHALAAEGRRTGIKLEALKWIRCFGETLTASVREYCENVFSVPLIDTYSAQEIGSIALQCPGHHHYHIQSEAMLVEILDENNTPCLPGEIGRVIISHLHNFAMPLIRYELGDYAEVDHTCACGRGLPVLKRIVGRVRNMIRLPNGKHHWPSFPADKWSGLASIRQIQLVQKTLHSIEVNYVSERKIDEQEEHALTQSLQQTLNYPFALRFIHHTESLHRSKNSKFEDFVSEL